MLRTALPILFRHRAAWLLILGVLAVALHALAGTGLMRSGANSGSGQGFVAEVCTSHGVQKPDLASAANGQSQPGSAGHDCCKLCAAGGPLLAAGDRIGVSPAPTLHVLHATHPPARPAAVAWTAHPPRGPPARA